MAVRGLGKGLDSLIPSAAVESKKKEVKNDSVEVAKSENKGPETIVKITKVEPNRKQPRKNFDEDALQELADSIKQFGLLQPILVQDRKDYYEIIAGERRWRAAKLAGLKEVPVIIREYTEKEIVEISLIENIQREDLSPIEEAEAYEKLIEKLDYTQEELSNRIGKSRVYVTNTLRLLKLPSEIRKMVNEEKLSPGHARCLIGLEENKAIELSEMAVKKNMTVRDLERLVSKKEKPQKEVKKDPYLENVRHIMESKLNTSIEVTKNKITISYNGNDNLNDILEKLGCLEEH